MLEVILVMCKKVTPVINNCWLQGCVVLDVQNEYVVFEWWSLVLESIAGILVVALQQYQSFSFLPYSSCCYRFLKPNFGTHGLYYSVEWEPDDNHGTLNRLCHTNTYTHILNCLYVVFFHLHSILPSTYTANLILDTRCQNSKKQPIIFIGNLIATQIRRQLKLV